MTYTEKQRTVDYKVVFDSPTGRKVLTDIMIKANVFRPIEHPDPIVAARMEGARALALHMASFVRFDADRFIDYWQQPKEII